MSDKPTYSAYETIITAAAMNSIAGCVWDALDEASTPEEALAAIGAMPSAPTGGPWVGQDGAWTGPGAFAHNSLSSRDAADGHPISAVTGLQSALDGKSATTHNHDSEYYTEAEIDSLASLREKLVWELDYAVDDTFGSHVIDLPANRSYRIVGIGLNTKTEDNSILQVQLRTEAGNLTASNYYGSQLIHWNGAGPGVISTEYATSAYINCGAMPKNSRLVPLGFELKLRAAPTARYTTYDVVARGWSSLLSEYALWLIGHVYGTGEAANDFTGIRIYTSAGSSTVMQRGRIQVFQGPVI